MCRYCARPSFREPSTHNAVRQALETLIFTRSHVTEATTACAARGNSRQFSFDFAVIMSGVPLLRGRISAELGILRVIQRYKMAEVDLQSAINPASVISHNSPHLRPFPGWGVLPRKPRRQRGHSLQSSLCYPVPPTPFFVCDRPPPGHTSPTANWRR